MKPGTVGHVGGSGEEEGGGSVSLNWGSEASAYRGAAVVSGGRAAETQARACSQPLFSWGITQNTSKWGKEPVPSSSDGQRPSA